MKKISKYGSVYDMNNAPLGVASLCNHVGALHVASITPVLG